MRKIGIQGIKGSYHDQVAKEYFGDAVEINEFLSFDELADSVFIGSSDFGIMAIENSIAGSIIPNYALIDNLNLNIVEECFVNINHQLMALPGVDLNDIETVSSHPMALLQCKKFFKDFPKISLIEARDTAGEAKRISENKIKNIGAIASVEASKLYKLNIIHKNIQTIEKNETRFVIVSKQRMSSSEDFDKASIKFSLSHKTGSLASVLTILRDYNLNLTKIQSLPIIEFPWKYSFFIDTTFNDMNDFNNAIELIGHKSESLKLLGIYKNRMK